MPWLAESLPLPSVHGDLIRSPRCRTADPLDHGRAGRVGHLPRDRGVDPQSRRPSAAGGDPLHGGVPRVLAA